jgi:hypothetical protein
MLFQERKCYHNNLYASNFNKICTYVILLVFDFKIEFVYDVKPNVNIILLFMIFEVFFFFL